MYVIYVLREGEGRKKRERERYTHTLQTLRIKLFSNLCAAHIFYCKQCFQAEADVDVSFSLLLYLLSSSMMCSILLQCECLVYHRKNTWKVFIK